MRHVSGDIIGGTHGRMAHILRACKHTARQFCANTTVHGYQYLIDHRRHPMERCIWLVFLVAISVFAFAISISSWIEYEDKPTVTSLQTQRYPIWDIPFPAVCICSINRISRRASREYAEYLVSVNDKLNVSWTMRQIRFLGRLYEFSDEQFDEMMDFQEILDRTDTMNGDAYDTETRMKQLTPKCKDLLLKCQWEGQTVPCDQIFSTRLTLQGYCCTFNYVRPLHTLSFSEVRRPQKTCYTGAVYGLVVVLNTSISDYYYPTQNSDGFSISITSPTEFPDETSGHFHKIVLPSRTEAFVMLDVRTVIAEPNVENCKPQLRGCLFDYEMPVEYGGHYSFTDCLIRCKIRNLIALCGCVPFNLPTNFPDFASNKKSHSRCNLSHLQCLNKYRNTINTLRTPLSSSVGYNSDEHTTADSVNCPECLPLCSQSTYQTETTYSRIVTRNYRRKSWGLMKNISQVDNVSILRVFHPYVTTMMYTTNLQYTWQEIIAYFGGLLGICLGFSIVSFIEIVYYVIYGLIVNLFFPRGGAHMKSPESAGIILATKPPKTIGTVPSYKCIEQMLLANRSIARRSVNHQQGEPRNN